MESIYQIPVSTPAEARCLRCSYLLQGLPRRVCPECGRQFDPADPRTYKLPRSPDALRALAHPPGAFEIIASVVVIASVLYESARLDPSLGLWWLGMPILVVYARRLAAIAVNRPPSRDAAQPARATKSRWARCRWLVAPVGLSLIASAWMFDWPLRVRFEFSRPALMRVVGNSPNPSPAGAGGAAPAIPGWVGLFYMREVNHFIDGRVRFVLDSSRSIWRYAGLCFEPRGPTRRNDRWLPTPWAADFSEF